jgi:hypothetical protein
MSAAEDLSVGFHSVADDPAMTVRTDWRQRMDCTLEAIERVMFARYDDFKCFVVFVSANFAFSHPMNPSRAAGVLAVSGRFVVKRSWSVQLWNGMTRRSRPPLQGVHQCTATDRPIVPQTQSACHPLVERNALRAAMCIGNQRHDRHTVIERRARMTQ